MTRITKDIVLDMASFAEEISNGNVRYGYSRSDTDGTVFVDGIRQLVWRGKYASSKAFAYYFGSCLPYMDDITTEQRDKWDEFNNTYLAIESRSGVEREFHNGNGDALSRKASRFPRSDSR